MKVEFFKHNLGLKELKSLNQASKSLFLTTGALVEDFELKLSKYLKIKSSVGLTSCTGALHLALLAAGIQPGDEVITTPLSFVATSHSILMAGARPIFVDVESTTGNLNADLIESAITPKTKAILPVHLYGQMVDMKKILEIANKHNLIVIEDAAHSLEAERDGIRPGTHSFGACFSFYATKAITSGEGGAFSSPDEKISALVKRLRSHGITSDLAQRLRNGGTFYDVDMLGWKYNMYNLQAALLLPQLARAEQIRKAREKVAKKYRSAFSKIGLEMPEWIKGTKHAHHLFTIWVDPQKREKIMAYLKDRGVTTVINYLPIHLFTYYKQNLGSKAGDFPEAEKIGQRTISIPLYAKLTDREVNYVIKTVIEAINKA